MKRCPECRRDYYDDTLAFCLEDGTPLVQGSVPAPSESSEGPATAIMHTTGGDGEAATTHRIHRGESETEVFDNKGTRPGRSNPCGKRLIYIPVGMVLIAVLGWGGYRYFRPVAPTGAIHSIAV